MTVKRLFAILFIFGCTVCAWFILGSALDFRTAQSGAVAAETVLAGWGPPIAQEHPSAYYQSPGSPQGKTVIRPIQSKVTNLLSYAPRRKGLLWYRTFGVEFRGEYIFQNNTPIPQTLFVQFTLPAEEASYNEFSFLLNNKPTSANVVAGQPIVEAVTLAAGEKTTLVVAYKTRGLDSWRYNFGQDSRVQNFEFGMKTNFAEIDFPAGTGSPTQRARDGDGWDLTWSYPDEIGARAVGMDMPNVLNPGPTASRITFFAPVSLVFFFAVLVILCLLLRVDLHPMNFFFLSAGCFAFQLLFAYLVDLIPIGYAFAISAGVSMVLVSGYLLLVVGGRFARLAAVAQFSYMVLFSYSFFFDGLTGLTITIGALITLALLMVVTARVNWSEVFVGRSTATPPPIPTSSSHV